MWLWCSDLTGVENDTWEKRGFYIAERRKNTELICVVFIRQKKEVKANNALEKYRYDYSIEIWGNYPSTVQETNESILRKLHSAGHPIIKQDITEMEKVQLRASRVPQQYNDLS